MRINKIDAARAQLRTAITMWFLDADPISIHTLAYAAHEIMDAVSKKRNPKRRRLLFDSARFKDARRKEVNDALRRHANFFKHGDRDPEAEVVFAPLLTESFIVFAIAAFESCGEKVCEEMSIFREWLRIQKSDSLSEAERKRFEEFYGIEKINYFRRLPKDVFFHGAMEEFKRGRI